MNDSDRTVLDVQAALQARSPVTLEVLCRRFGWSADQVMAAVVIGSRLWGTATHASDYDVIVVLYNTNHGNHMTEYKNGGNESGNKSPSKTGKKAKDNKKIKTTADTAGVTKSSCPVIRHSGDIDCSVYSCEGFRASLVRGDFLPVATLFAPAHMHLKPDTAARWMRSLQTIVIPDAVTRQTLDNVERTLQRSAKEYRKGQCPRSVKQLVHALRMLVLTHELITTGRMEQWDCVNSLARQFQYGLPSTWEECQAFFWPHFVQGRQALQRHS